MDLGSEYFSAVSKSPYKSVEESVVELELAFVTRVAWVRLCLGKTGTIFRGDQARRLASRAGTFSTCAVA